MRIGSNPLKKRPQLPPYKRHRIIIPVYIGADHEYFAQSTETLKLSLRSLYATIDLNRVSITVINNNSIPEVDEILAPYAAAGRIDRYIRHQVNRGKPDAVAGEILATYEPFVTLTDCDVLFYPGWMRKLEDVFCRYRGVGAVSPFPVPNHAFYENATTWLSALGSLRVRAGTYVKNDALSTFVKSIGMGEEYFKPEARLTQFRYSGGTPVALIGSGHFVVMFRRSAFQRMVYVPKLAGASNGERDVDAMPDRAGYLRLSTPEYHVYHLGNVVEPWMESSVAEVEAAPAVPLTGDQDFAPALRGARPAAALLPGLFRRGCFPSIRIAGMLYRRWRHSGLKGIWRSLSRTPSV